MPAEGPEWAPGSRGSPQLTLLQQNGFVSEHPPAPRQINSWEMAEQNAADWMRYWGYADARVTQGGADGGVDVTSRSALAQVKFEARQVGSPTLQRLVGARRNAHHKQLMFFSGVGYARPAIEYADAMEIALFTYDLLGAVTPVNPRGEAIVASCRSTARSDRPPSSHALARRTLVAKWTTGRGSRFPTWMSAVGEWPRLSSDNLRPPAQPGWSVRPSAPSSRLNTSPAAPAPRFPTQPGDERPKKAGRGWWFRNWSAVLAGWWTILSMGRLLTYLRDGSMPLGWGNFIAGLVGIVVMLGLWLALGQKRRQWKTDRDAHHARQSR